MTWNTETIPGVKDKSVIGNPINYVMETVVSKNDLTKNPDDVPYNHLLVYYSDPVYRSTLKTLYPDKVYRYIGESKILTLTDGWFDLGYVKGEPGGIHIIGNVANEDDLYNDGAAHNNPKKPEDIGGNRDYAGWVMTVHDPLSSVDPIIYAFDYVNNVWYVLGSINSSLLDPESVVAVSNLLDEPSKLNTKGLWLITSQAIAAK